MQLLRSHKNSKFIYYSINFLKNTYPNYFYRKNLNKHLNKLSDYDLEYIKHRVNYYNKLNTPVDLPKDTKSLSKLKLKDSIKPYYFDSKEFSRFFMSSLKVNFLFGDITYIPEFPSILKSRPITGNQENAILFKLNKIRHFIFTKDTNTFSDKKNKLIGRTMIKKRLTHRVKFYEMYFNHPLCNLGQKNKNTTHDHWVKKKISIEKHLKYKFILSLEGEDVASNLKWIMSSNSIAIMPKPSYETWFMEKTLIPNYHYIEIKSDYSDLEEKLNYYINNTEACLKIIKNANTYVDQFKDTEREKLISLLVLEKYFVKTNQLPRRTDLLY